MYVCSLWALALELCLYHSERGLYCTAAFAYMEISSALRLAVTISAEWKMPPERRLHVPPALPFLFFLPVLCSQAELQQVAESLRQSTKQLCRNLKDNPNVQENMAKVSVQTPARLSLISCRQFQLFPIFFFRAAVQTHYLVQSAEPR